MSRTGKSFLRLALLTALFAFLTVPVLAGTYPDVYLDPGSGERLGWMQTPDGRWKYADGLYLRGWHDIGGHRYYFDSNGDMQTGWVELDGVKYYLAESTVEGHPKGSLYTEAVTPEGVSGAAEGASAERANPYGHTCVEVDVTNQTVYFYIGEKLILSTPCVTGYKGVHDTPAGNYSISYKARDTYLTGPTWRSFVNYWMPFNGGIGLHDATWRGYGPENFGGQVYVTNGSHGCVNLPHAAAQTIYESAYAGMPVHVHY